jgi:hypothetical protein
VAFSEWSQPIDQPVRRGPGMRTRGFDDAAIDLLFVANPSTTLAGQRGMRS